MGGFVMAERARGRKIGRVDERRKTKRAPYNGICETAGSNQTGRPGGRRREGGSRVGFWGPNAKRPHRSGYAKPPTWSGQVEEREKRATGEEMGDIG